MQIILLQDVDGLGEQFQTVEVRPGYGRNFLIPKKLAVVANRANQAMADQRLKQIMKREQRVIAEIEAMIGQINARPIKVGAKVGTTEKIFGSVNNVQLAEAIKAQTGVEIDRRKIMIEEEVKTLGEYVATIKFREGQKYDIKFEVVAE